jgi:hypothetical protein
MSRSTKSTRRSLSFQQLEDRKVFAGDVSADVVNGNLVITGDSASNQIEVTQTALNWYKVTGLNGTEINGRADRLFRVTGGMTMNMNGGNDVVKIGGEIFDIDIDGALTVNGGSGIDTVTLLNADVDGNITIDTDDGADIVRVSAIFGLGNLTIRTDAGADEVDVNVSTISGFTNIDTGSENDVVDLLFAKFNGGLKVNTQAGEDSINLEIVQAPGKTITVLTGDDDDLVNLREVVADKFFADLGEDDDEIRLKNVKFNLTDIDGGDDSDDLIDLGGNQFGVLVTDSI